MKRDRGGEQRRTCVRVWRKRSGKRWGRLTATEAEDGEDKAENSIEAREDDSTGGGRDDAKELVEDTHGWGTGVVR